MPIMHLPLYFLGVAVGVVILAKSADWFTDAAVSIARRLDVPEIIIGATLVSLATTLPEFSVSVTAALAHQVEMAVGNAVGSTICNIGLILGLCIVLAPMGVERKGFLRSGVGLLVLCLLFAFMGWAFPEGTRWTGAVLLACLVICFVTTLRSTSVQRANVAAGARTARAPAYQTMLERIAAESRADGVEGAAPDAEMTGARIAAYFMLGSAGVVWGSSLVVFCAEQLALAAGISKQVIALTLVAFGTSMPELVVSLTAIAKKQRGLSIGNIIGANILNLAWVLGVSSIIAVIPFDAQSLYFDIPVMLFITLLLLVFGATGKKLSRWEGMVLMMVYAAYLAVLFTVYRAPAAAL